jgi:NAD(P)-dependent dehydrogenase (short-subunit alcohol dehydrogenase family)
MKRLDNKVAIVTGASKGIGAGIANAFGAEGAAVVVNYARDHEGAERVVREITGKGGRAIAVQGDVAQRSEAQRLVAEAKQAFGRLGSTQRFPTSPRVRQPTPTAASWSAKMPPCCLRDLSMQPALSSKWRRYTPSARSPSKVR